MIKPLILMSSLHLLSFSFSLFSLPGTHPSSHRRLAPSSARQVSTRAQTPPRRAAAVPRLRAAAPDATDATAALMVARAEAGDFAEARSLWAQLLHSSAAPCLPAVAPRLLPAYPFLDITDEVHMDNEFGLMGLATTISESVHRTIDASINHLPVLVCLGMSVASS
jgi:hypothetical protein